MNEIRDPRYESVETCLNTDSLERVLRATAESFIHDCLVLSPS